VKDFRDSVVAAQGGDKEAFTKLVRRFQDMAYGVAYAMLGDAALAQDAAQESFIEAYLSLPTLREPVAFPGWLRRVVIKYSDRELRSRKPTVPLDEVGGLPTEADDPPTVLETLERRRTVHKAVAELPTTQRQIVTLFYLWDYSQKEIGEFLELSASAIKKHLFTARKKLKGRLETMVERQVQSSRPSRTDAFSNEVQYLLALRTGDLEGFKAVAERQPELLEMRFETRITPAGHYWPVGGTALHWAVVTGNEILLAFLRSRHVDVNITDKYGMTPLHTAVWMRQEAITQHLLAAGADPNAKNNEGQTPLHLAAMRNHGSATEILLQAGARADIADKSGRTPTDWALLKGARRSR
jgi:RNA polymerase sigma factor (sigma-70 family)